MASSVVFRKLWPSRQSWVSEVAEARRLIGAPSVCLAVLAMAALSTTVSLAQTATEVVPTPPPISEMLGAPITTLTTDIRVKENPRVPNDVPRSEVPAKFFPKDNMSYVMNRPGAEPVCYMWEAPATCNYPLYFEDANLERHGYSLRYLRAFQPIVSGAEFFVTIPAMPYLMCATPPACDVYTLGQYRAGDCVPYQIDYPPWSVEGGLAEAGTAVGLVFLIP